ncbi:hypothetical protein PR003_g15821 [Phytophthora rubi]|uniref:MULE transposase domain-containing protein n=1 Tax=Phytophthora rubi TaxID=129364 RepID=A0A6A4ETZ2_9STRA|nr:hypothetical protein PR001_g14941 [Phytophthora rubi]KAE9328278.1 hypothetical protein PR003_g15821 [Phytophthora rubi]
MHVKTFKSTADALRYLQSRENTAFRERSQFRRTTVLGCASHVDCKAQARVTEPDDKTYTLSTSGYHTLHLVPSTPDSSDNGQHCFSSSESESSSSEADNYLGICESEVDPAVVDADINDENGADDINSDEAVMREFGISSCSNDEFDIGDSSFGSAAEESSDDSDEAANTCITDAQMNDANEDDVRVLGPFKTRELARVAIDRFTNIRYKRHNNNRDTVWYKCSTHTNCSATAKIKLTASNKMYTATLIGIHSDVEAPLSDQRTGIHKPLEDEVNNLLLGGQGPARCLTTLEMKYRNDEDMLRLLPDVTQLKNRSQLLHSRGDYNISSMADIMKWAAPKMCKSKEVFFKEEENAYQVVGDPKTFAKTPFNYRHELLVLDIFTEPVGKKDVSYGIIFTTRKLFRNAALAALGQREGVLAVTDGTYKIDFNNWTLISFGTCGVRYTTKKQYQHKFYPIAFLFVRAETTLAYNKLFTVVKNFTSDFFGGDLNVKFGSMDHSAAIASAFRNIWPDIELLDCWPHLDRKSRGKEGLLSDTQVYKDIIKPQLDQLETARSCEQLFALSELVSQNWREQKQGAYANWFDEQYLTDPWDLWFITASNVAGIVPNQNPIEAHHSAIKKVAAGHLRAAISHVLAVTLPKILIHCGRDKNTEFLWPFASGPVDEKVFQAAKLLSKSGNYYPSHERMSKREITKIDRYFFNSDYYLIHDGNLYGQKVTHARTSLYAKSLEGVLKKDEVVNNIQLAYQSLHAVDILTRESIEHDWASPIWTIEEVSVYVCVQWFIAVSLIVCMRVSAYDATD